MTANKNRTVDLLCGAFDLNDRRKFELTNEKGDHVVDLYFKAITPVSYTHLTLPTKA